MKIYLEEKIGNPALFTGRKNELTKLLEWTDIIERGRTNFDYKGVQDNIFDKIFRGEYQKEIDDFDPKEITGEYKIMFDELPGKYRKLMEKHGFNKFCRANSH